MPGLLSIEITAVRRIGPKPDGTPRRNSSELDVLINGAPHVIRVRRESGVLKLPPEIAQHPNAAEIKTRVTNLFLERLGQRVEELQAARLAAGLTIAFPAR